jgi:hypothetical protein
MTLMQPMLHDFPVFPLLLSNLWMLLAKVKLQHQTLSQTRHKLSPSNDKHWTLYQNRLPISNDTRT